MKAVVIDQFGGPDVLEARDVALPVTGPTEVLVEVFAVGLNPVDFKIRQGHLNDLLPTTFPRILGGDIAGIVRSVGADVQSFSVGDEVFFSNPLDRDGGYAEFVAVDAQYVARKPATLSWTEAASLPVAGLTAIQALRDFGHIKRGSKVLIHAAAGGVGSFAVQYAKHMGAVVYATASAAKADYVRSLGADYVIDYRQEDFVDFAHQHGGMDIVLESIGGLNYPRSIAATRDGGAVPSIVNPPDPDSLTMAARRSIKTDFMLLRGEAKDLQLIAELADHDIIRPTVSRVYELEQIRQAHGELEAGRTSGKLVVAIASARSSDAGSPSQF